MFAITGGGLAKLDHMKNGGKRGRWGIDSWDRVRIGFSNKQGAMTANSCAAKYESSTYDTYDILTGGSDGAG